MRRGQALVEAALILPILLYVMLAGVALGLVVLHRMQLQHAAIETSIVAAHEDCAAGLAGVADLLGYEPDAKTCELVDGSVEVMLANSIPTIVPGIPDNVIVTGRSAVRPSPSPSP
jgi:uncharacterized membrane protein